MLGMVVMRAIVPSFWLGEVLTSHASSSLFAYQVGFLLGAESAARGIAEEDEDDGLDAAAARFAHHRERPLPTPPSRAPKRRRQSSSPSLAQPARDPDTPVAVPEIPPPPGSPQPPAQPSTPIAVPLASSGPAGGQPELPSEVPAVDEIAADELRLEVAEGPSATASAAVARQPSVPLRKVRVSTYKGVWPLPNWHSLLCSLCLCFCPCHVVTFACSFLLMT